MSNSFDVVHTHTHTQTLIAVHADAHATVSVCLFGHVLVRIHILCTIFSFIDTFVQCRANIYVICYVSARMQLNIFIYLYMVCNIAFVEVAFSYCIKQSLFYYQEVTNVAQKECASTHI